MTKEELVAEGVLILEQEGWIVERLAHEAGSGRRVRAFAERYTEWQQKVNEFRRTGAVMWPAPPDNS